MFTLLFTIFSPTRFVGIREPRSRKIVCLLRHYQLSSINVTSNPHHPIMVDFEQFEQVFGSKIDNTYHQQTIDDICRNRQALENELFIDRLLKTLGIDKGTFCQTTNILSHLLTYPNTIASRLYPPRSGLELRKIHEKVVSSHFQSHHKISVLYYLRKEFPNTSRQAAEDLAKKFYLPEKYRILIDGLWFLDRLKFEVT